MDETADAPNAVDGSVSGSIATAAQWPIWRLVAFRFFTVYWLLRIAPWGWLGGVPYAFSALSPTYAFNSYAVHWANDRFFHVSETLVPVNGSGDTSFAWAELQLYLWVALIACVVWSIIDYKRKSYPRADYWLRTILRYYIASAALSYGIIKILALQMIFPNPSQLVTPLGDLLPMRFSWLFIGYSTPYQMFSGFVEFTAGILLLYRRTVTTGLLLAAGAFANVMMINLAYDVPVKLYSTHLFVACVFLLLYDAPRLWSLFILNRPVASNHDFDPYANGRNARYVRWLVKAYVLWLFLITPAWGNLKRSGTASAPPKSRPFAVGLYDVKKYVVNRDTVSATSSDTLRWRDLAFDSNGSGSVGSPDSMYWQRYHRGYFRYKPDTVAHTVAFWRTGWTPADSATLFKARYEMPDSNTIRMWTVIRNDSVYVELAKSDRHFQLTERQFHWLSDYNR